MSGSFVRISAAAVALFFAQPSFAACAKMQGLDATLYKSADLIMRAELISYRVLDKPYLAEVQLKPIEILHGSYTGVTLTALWQRKDMGLPRAWTRSRNVVLGLTQSGAHEEPWKIVQTSCSWLGVMYDDDNYRAIIENTLSDK